jgi:hypothetical protein
MRPHGIDGTSALSPLVKDTGVIVIRPYLTYGELVRYLYEILLHKFGNPNPQEFGYGPYLAAVYQDSAALPVTTSPLTPFAGPWVERK